MLNSEGFSLVTVWHSRFHPLCRSSHFVSVATTHKQTAWNALQPATLLLAKMQSLQKQVAPAGPHTTRLPRPFQHAFIKSTPKHRPVKAKSTEDMVDPMTGEVVARPGSRSAAACGCCQQQTPSTSTCEVYIVGCEGYSFQYLGTVL